MILSLDKIENLDISSHHFSIKSYGIKDPVIFRFRNIYYCFKNDQFFLKFCRFIKKPLFSKHYLFYFTIFYRKIVGINIDATGHKLYKSHVISYISS